VKRAACDAYIRGLADGIFIADNFAREGTRYCPPGRGSPMLDEVKRIVVAFLREHPNELHRPAGSVASAALDVAFACRK